MDLAVRPISARLDSFWARLDGAAAGELNTLIHENLGRAQGAVHARRDVKLDSFAGVHGALQAAALHDQQRGLDFRVDFGAIADNEHARGANLPAKTAVDADAAVEFQLSLEVGATAEQ